LGSKANGSANKPMTLTQEQLISRWLQFRDAFVRQLERTSTDELRSAWTRPSRRTKLYTREVLPAIATDLELRPTTELFKVDAALRIPAPNGELVPIVFIESENVATTAGHEMRKLCAVSCPVAVLVTVVEWNPAVFGQKAWADRLQNEWQRIMKAHYEVWPRPGIIGIIVGEWGDDWWLRFYSLAYLTDGSVCVPQSEDFSRLIQSLPSQPSINV